MTKRCRLYYINIIGNYDPNTIVRAVVVVIAW